MGILQIVKRFQFKTAETYDTILLEIKKKMRSDMNIGDVSEAWDRAMGESIMLTAHINGTLRDVSGL